MAESVAPCRFSFFLKMLRFSQKTVAVSMFCCQCLFPLCLLEEQQQKTRMKMTELTSFQAKTPKLGQTNWLATPTSFGWRNKEVSGSLKPPTPPPSTSQLDLWTAPLLLPSRLKGSFSQRQLEGSGPGPPPASSEPSALFSSVSGACGGTFGVLVLEDPGPQPAF